MWLMKYRLPDGTESTTTLSAAWVNKDPQNRDGWLPKRGRPPEGKLNEDAARGALQAFLDQQTDRTPLERITFERCADAFLESCREKGRSPTTLRTYGQIVGEVRPDGATGGPSTSTPTNSRTIATSSPSAASPGARSTSAAPCCRASSRSRGDA